MYSHSLLNLYPPNPASNIANSFNSSKNIFIEFLYNRLACYYFSTEQLLKIKYLQIPKEVKESDSSVLVSAGLIGGVGSLRWSLIPIYKT
jgi:hypothetical protein